MLDSMLRFESGGLEKRSDWQCLAADGVYEWLSILVHE